MTEPAIEPAKERQHEGAIADGIPELGEGAGHRLEVTTKVGDGRRPLLDCVELGGEEVSVRFALAK